MKFLKLFFIILLGATVSKSQNDSLPGLKLVDFSLGYSQPLGIENAGDTRLFITPGFQYQIVDAMITNFHLPQSTLLMLVAAMIGLDAMTAAYAHAIDQRYRFFSYGDAMFLERNRTQ